MPIRLYLDENVDAALALALQRRHFDVCTARDRGMLGTGDTEHLALAVAEKRAILTHDIGDFARLHVETLAQGRQHAGIIVSNMVSLGDLVRRTLRLLGSVSEEELQNSLVFLEQFKD